MPKKGDPEWEIVDELPSEKRKRQKTAAKPQKKKSLWFSKPVWIGIAVGAVAAAIFPFFRVFVIHLARSWWLWLAILAYWYWRRLQKAGK